MNNILFIIITTLALISGCASTHMKQYVGKDIREIIIDSGPPINAFDMSEGKRAFQFRWGGGTYVVPQTTTVTGTTTTIGNSAWYTGTAITAGGNSVTSEGCILTYIANWNKEMKSWIVTETRFPKKLVC